MTIRLFCFLLIVTCGCQAQLLIQFNKDSAILREYVGGDEFSSKHIDEQKWFIGFPWGRALLQQDNYVLKRNYAIEDGNIVMIVDKLDSIIKLGPYEHDTAYLQMNNESFVGGDSYKFAYSTFLLWSKQKYQYGYFEIKFKGVEGRGIWPAFWLYGGNPNHEIDFFELKGEREKQMHLDIHCPSGCSDFRKNLFGQRRRWGHWVKLKDPINEDFNIVAGIWTAHSIKWFLNGELIAYSEQNMSVPMSIIVGTGAAKNNGPFKPGPDARTPFPNKFIVDYIRVYKLDKRLPYSNYQPCAGVSDTTNQKAKNRFTAKPKRVNKRNVESGINNTFVSLIPKAPYQLEVRVIGLEKGRGVVFNWMDHENRCQGTNIININTEQTIDVSSAVSSVKVGLGEVSVNVKLKTSE